MVVFKASSSFH